LSKWPLAGSRQCRARLAWRPVANVKAVKVTAVWGVQGKGQIIDDDGNDPNVGVRGEGTTAGGPELLTAVVR